MEAIIFYELFNPGQYGRFYINKKVNSLGIFFDIYILPKEENVVTNSLGKCLNPNAVKVFGIVSVDSDSQRIKHGWIHKGKWQEDFQYLVLQKEKEKKIEFLTDKEKSDFEKERVKRFLEDY